MFQSVIVRPAEPSDAAHLTEIAVEAYSVYLSRLPADVRPAPVDADYAAVIDDGGAWVAESDGMIAGFAVIIPRTDHTLLDNIAVHPDFQGRGVGRRLLALVEDRAEAHGLGTVRLYTHEVMVENQRLYERLGFIETGRRSEGGLDRVFYEKRISR